MSGWRQLFFRFRALFRKQELDARLDEEMRSHLEMQTEANIEAGMSQEEARRAARRQFGWVDSVKEACRDQRGVSGIENLAQDILHGIRAVGKSPGFAIIAMLTLGLGIGGTTAVFTVVNTLLLQPLPWPESDRVVSLREANPHKNMVQAPMAAAQFVDLRREAKSFSALAAWNPAAVNLASDGGVPERHAAALVTEDFFKVLGIGPALGSPFAAAHFQSGQDGVTLISHAVWQQRFGGDSNIVGRTLAMNGRVRTIVGVMPAGFQPLGQAAFWVPKVFSPHELEDRDYKSQYVLGRLAVGVTLPQARAEVEALFADLSQQFSDVLEGWQPLVDPALDVLVKPLRPALLILLAAVGLVLLMACLNVASLLLSRGAARQGELGVRAALGASRRRLACQSLCESLVLAIPGGLLGLGIAQGLLVILLRFAPPQLPRLDQVRLDFEALCFTATVCLLALLLAGLFPALHQAQADPMDALRTGSSRSTSRVGRWRRGLVVFQVGATVVILLAAGLLLRSFERLVKRDLGFEPARLLTVRLELPPIKYSGEHRRDRFAEEVLARLAVTPGVESAAASTYLPLQGWPQLIMRLEEKPVFRPSDASSSGYTGVSQEYFRTFGMRLLQGRGFTPNDREGTALVCVVNQTFVRTHFGNRDPLGKRLEIGLAEPPNWLEIVGVVNDTQNEQLELQPKEQVFVPLRQQPHFLRGNPAISLIVRSLGPPSELSSSIRRAVWAVDRDQPLYLLQPMTQVLDSATAQRRFTVLVLGTFAAVALALAAIGLFGVMNGTVAARTKEIGVRMALGAQRSDVACLVLSLGARTLAAGLALGALAAFGAGRVLESQLFETQPLDPPTWMLVIALLSSVGLGACLAPAVRAARLHPVEALRSE